MSKLFEPIKVGSVQLGHRLAMAPLTRFRAGLDGVQIPEAKDYYSQRGCVPGTLLITEATLISEKAYCQNHVPGIWSDDQITAWKNVTDAVHAKGSKIALQLWHQGRAGKPDVLKAHGGRFLSSSAVPISSDSPTPEAMSEDDIQTAIADFAIAAKNAMAAGFDMVEVHAANGYLPDQFTQDTCNKRTDAWGGSIEKRCRFAVEVIKACCDAVGADKTGVRLSPYSDFQAMLMDDPDSTFKYLLETLKPLSLAYLHLVEARIRGGSDGDATDTRTVKWLVELWDNASPVLVAGGFTPESARKAVNETYKNNDVMIVFGRYFISNPDLVFKIESDIALTKYERPTFYTPMKPEGYSDYPFSPEYLQSVAPPN